MEIGLATVCKCIFFLRGCYIPGNEWKQTGWVQANWALVGGGGELLHKNRTRALRSCFVVVAWLEMCFTPKRYSKTTHYLLSYIFLLHTLKKKQ